MVEFELGKEVTVTLSDGTTVVGYLSLFDRNRRKIVVTIGRRVSLNNGSMLASTQRRYCIPESCIGEYYYNYSFNDMNDEGRLADVSSYLGGE